MNDRRAHCRLDSPLFLAALSLLVLNDAVLKTMFPGLITGKLSDFAGIFAFAYFCSSFVPKLTAVIHITTALGFVFWKSLAAEPLINFWNSATGFEIGRVVDPSDLVALIVLPLSYKQATSFVPTSCSRFRTVAVSAVSLLAFAATSYRTTADYKTTFLFAGTPAHFLSELEKRKIRAVDSEFWEGAPEPGSYELFIPSEACYGEVQATVLLSADGPHTVVRLKRMTHTCSEKGNEKVWLFRIFKTSVADPLKLAPFLSPQAAPDVGPN